MHLSCTPQRSGRAGWHHRVHKQLLPAPRLQAASPCRASRKKPKSGGNGGSGGSGGSVPSGGSSSSSGGGSGGGPGADSHRLQDTIRESRQQQLAATDMLAKLLQEEQPQAVAELYIDSLDEQFFWTANTYLAMAKKEGNAEVVGRLEAALRAAFEAKQATLRPEIQLLNRLLATEGAEQRAAVLAAAGAGEQLVMNDRYFFGLLERMLADVRRQPEGEQRTALVGKLESIHQQAETAAAGKGGAAPGA